MITEDRKNFYIELINSSFSLREVCIKAGIVVTTGNYNTLKRIIKENDIDISHFKRQNGNNNTPKDIEFYLKENSVITSHKLKNKLLKNGFKEHRCECCGLTEWLGQPIKLELHHINGDNTDNRLENLQILCPNCHSYTDNYGGKNQKLNIKEKKHKIHKDKFDINLLKALLIETNDLNIIGKKINRSPRTINKYIKLYGLEKKKEPKYDIDEMILLMKQYQNYTKVGAELGISDNAVKKRFVRLGYPDNIRELILKL